MIQVYKKSSDSSTPNDKNKILQELLQTNMLYNPQEI